MKSIGEQAKEFRESKGWNTTRMAKEVGTSRQNIENLELKGNRKPHYIIDLARVIGATVDAMLAGEPAQPGVIPSDYKPNQPLAGESIGPVAINGIATLEQSLEGLAHYLAVLHESDRAEAMRAIAILATEPERHAKTAAGIKASVGAAFAPSPRKAA